MLDHDDERAPLLARLAASVPAKGTHTVRYAGVLASASKLRPRIVPKPPVAVTVVDEASEAKPKREGCRYRTWAELLRTLGIDAFECLRCQGRMRLLALVRDPDDVRAAVLVPMVVVAIASRMFAGRKLQR